MNRMKTLVLLAALTGLLLWGGNALGGKSGFAMALGLAVIMNVGAYWYSDRIVLRMQRAIPVEPGDERELYAIIQGLAARAGLPMPRVYVIPQETPNAFATGRNPHNAAVAVTEGLLGLLSRREITAVLAHEMAHIKNRDTLVMTVAATLGGALSTLADIAAWSALFGRGQSESDGGHHPLAGLVDVIVAPFAAMMIQTAISRSREFMADEAGAALCGDPQGLASALTRIEGWNRLEPMTDVRPVTAHLFIINPLHGGGFARMFSTHPPVAERVKRLEEMAQNGRYLIAA